MVCGMPVEDAVPLSHRLPTEIDLSDESKYDDAARLAAALCRTSTGMVMLLDEQRRWARASGALRLREAAISTAFCEEALRHAEPLVVQDAARDERFRADPQVTGEPHLRFVAAVRLTHTHGQPLGVLCVTDLVPRVLTAEQEGALELLARQLRARMELADSRQQLEALTRERESSAANLRASEELFRTFMNASPFLSYIKDAAGRLLFYNRSYARRFGVSEFAWLGKTDEQLWSRSAANPVRMQDLEIMAGGRMVESEERLRSPDGTVSSWKTYKFPCYDSAGNMLLAGVAVDVTEDLMRKEELERVQEEMQEANEQLRRLSVTDELTNLRNRRAFEERLVLEFSVARRRKRELAIVLLDVDNFKKINDRWGHGAGDDVLRRLSAVLRTTIRLPDLVARYGGEEFVVLLPESGVEGAQGFANRLMERIASEAWEHEQVTISAGIAAIQDTLVNGFQLVGMADEALYAAKRAGKNRVVTYDSIRK